jgi:hypothetical protein
MQNTPTPKGYTDIIGKQIADSVASALAKLAHDQANPLHFNQKEKDKINGIEPPPDQTGNNDPRNSRAYGRKYVGSPTFHKGYYDTGEVFGPDQETAAHKKERTFVGPQQDTAQHIFDTNWAKLETSTAKDAIAKINSAGDGAAGALASAAESVKGGASSAAGSIAAGGENVAGALNQAASAISGAAARIGAAGGTPAVAPQATGQKERGNR